MDTPFSSNWPPGLPSDKAAGGVRGAVRPVRAHGEDSGVPQAGDPLGRGKGNLLVPAALAGPQ